MRTRRSARLRKDDSSASDTPVKQVRVSRRRKPQPPPRLDVNDIESEDGAALLAKAAVPSEAEETLAGPTAEAASNEPLAVEAPPASPSVTLPLQEVDEVTPIPKQSTDTVSSQDEKENYNPNIPGPSLQPPEQIADTTGPDFSQRPIQKVVYTYGRRRRAARVSLPSMEALGVRARTESPQSDVEEDSGEAQEDSLLENEDADEEEYEMESDGESGTGDASPKASTDPQLDAFVKQQRALWDEVDDIDLVVESD